MIVLDTNVVSELMNPKGSTAVKQWAKRQLRDRVFTTTITQAEILYGIGILPEGNRKRRLESAAHIVFQEELANHILPFDSKSAEQFAVISAQRRSQGKPISQFDAQIAAICRAQGAAIATRNVDDFVGCNLEITNPWEA